MRRNLPNLVTESMKEELMPDITVFQFNDDLNSTTGTSEAEQHQTNFAKRERNLEEEFVKYSHRI